MPVVERQLVWGSRDEQDHPWLAQCDIPGCHYCTAHGDFDDAAVHLEYHLCPWQANMTEWIKDMTQGRTQFQKMWHEMDSLMVRARTVQDQMNNLSDDATVEDELELTAALGDMKGQMRGLAFAIVCVMDPIFPDVKSVAKEAQARLWRADANEEQSTPGVDYEWRAGQQGPRIPQAIPSSPVVAQPKPVNVQFLEAQVRKALASGVPFTDQELATMYKVSPSWVAGLR